MRPRHTTLPFRFLKDDVVLAERLREGLSPHLRVFVFSDRQEEIAGTDGLETFRDVFRCDSRLVVVLFRTGWGETPWTRIEQQAITDRFLKEGPDFLFFIMVDSKSNPPPWLPENRIRFNLEDFGIDQAVGAIKLRVNELGGSFRKESIAEIAIRSQTIAAFNRETSTLMNSETGVKQASESASSLLSHIEQCALEAKNAAPGLDIEVCGQVLCLGIRSPRASVKVTWVNAYSNILQDSYLCVEFFRCKIILPGENLYYIMGPPKVHVMHKFLPERVHGLGWCWRDDRVTRSSPQLAEYILGTFLEEIKRTE